MKKSVLLITLMIVLLTACDSKTELATLVSDDAMGYNLQDYLGQPMDDVLEALKKGGVNAQLNEAYANREGLDVYSIADTMYGHESTSELMFTEFGDPAKMRLMSVSNTYYQPEWPAPDVEISQDIVKLYAALLDAYGEPTSKAPTLQDPDKIMENPAEIWAEWSLDDGASELTFAISGDETDNFCRVVITQVNSDGINAYRENR